MKLTTTTFVSVDEVMQGAGCQTWFLRHETWCGSPILIGDVRGEGQGGEDRQSYHRAVTLAAMWSAIFNAESAGLALHVLMSIMTLFLSASARPQPQPGALAFC
jgi:3-hydroxyisobutyrate dehydrogenase-like beta-hydroxyacid dehydrogenase